MHAGRWLPLCLLLVSAGCFHQIVRTGRAPATTIVDRPWVATWLWGLVPAQELDLSAQCSNGVAVVETRQSFINGLVGTLTLGIYTPQHVRVTCASDMGSLPKHAPEITVARAAAAGERAEAFRRAVEQAIDRHAAVVVRF